MNSNDITVTDDRLIKALSEPVAHIVSNTVPQQIKKATEDLQIKTGTVTKFYPYLDKVEIKINGSKTTEVCKILHNFSGSLLDLFTPEGELSFCDKLKEPCIIPQSPLYGCVVDINDGTNERLFLGYYHADEFVGFEPASKGAMKIMSFGGIKENYIEFSGRGLKIQTTEEVEMEVGERNNDTSEVKHAHVEDVYDKPTIDEKFENIHDEVGVSTDELLVLAEDYNTVSREEKYTLFRGDCWTINNNYESSAAIISASKNDFTVKGTFRTHQDMVGIYWNSRDMITHPYISYGSRIDYSNVVFECDVEFQNCLFDELTSDFASTFTIQMNDGSIYYAKTKEYMTYPQGKPAHLRIDFNNIIIPEGSEYVNKRGETIAVTTPFRLNVSNIKFIMFVLIPPTYEKPPDYDSQGITYYTIRSNLDYYCKFTNITVENGDICKEHIQLDPHQYRLCEGYDDFYNLNPYRVCREMRKLGYIGWVDLYIGASHYYEKSGTVGELIPVSRNADEFGHSRTEKMVLDTTVPLNKAFSAWLDCYSRELKANDCPNLVVSVSMENLQCPDDWKQRDSRGNPALTGWVPSTFFYSPCHPDILPYMQSVSQACLDIVVANDMPPILQLGEAWWWWNEYIDHENKSPCFYDDYTKAKYYQEFGKNMTEYVSPYVEIFDTEMMDWLNKQIVDYSWGIREVVKSDRYTDGKYMALFFPPSVLDIDRVPPMMQRVNYLTGIYNKKQLDVLQIEDYDWVTGNPTDPEHKERDRSHHHEAYEIGATLGFKYSEQHYFGGFVQYPEDATEFWRLIKKSMDDAIELGFAEVFVWAGSQVRRDNKILGYDDYEMVQYLLYSNDKSATIITTSGNENVPDSGVIPIGWQEFPKTEIFWNVTEETALKYRRDNNVVKLKGILHLHENPNNLTELLVGRLPAGFRPSSDRYIKSKGKQSNNDDITWVCCIRTNGEVYVMNVLEDNESVRPTVGDQYTVDEHIVFFMI